MGLIKSKLKIGTKLEIRNASGTSLQYVIFEINDPWIEVLDLQLNQKLSWLKIDVESVCRVVGFDKTVEKLYGKTNTSQS